MKLAALFGDHAVLQRDKVIPVWGWTEPEKKVTVKLGPHSAYTMSQSNGKFMVRFPSFSAGGPYTLSAEDEDGNKVISEDIMIGEIWIGSGQSNMQYTYTHLNLPENEIVKNNHVRMISVPLIAANGKQVDFKGKWTIGNNAKEMLTWSAVGHQFVLKLQEELGITIGFIASSWGGTLIEAWTSRETLMRNPDMSGLLKRYESSVCGKMFWDNYQTELAQKRYITDPGNVGEEKGWANLDFDDDVWMTMELPRSWRANGLNMNGALWFRKEINVPESWTGKDLSINLGAIDKHDVSYFNGTQIGSLGTDLEEQYWNVHRQYTIPADKVKAGKNIIAVRAYSFAFDGGLIGPSDVMQIAPADGSADPISLVGHWKYAIEHDIGNFAAMGQDASQMGPGNQNSLYILFDSMIEPLLPCAMRGVIWYQGESSANRGNPNNYYRMQTDLINDWRYAWGQDDFPFLIVQLANFREPREYEPTALWPIVRDAQMKALKQPNTGMAVTIDIGEADDIHPKNKRDVGIRLANWALRDTYGFNIVPSGPIYRDMIIDGDKIRILFDYVGGGLVAKDGQELKTFVIAGLDEKFVPAKAVIDGMSVIVSSPGVPEPYAVRYAWADNPEGCNLYNAEGLPASPFRTDTWQAGK